MHILPNQANAITQLVYQLSGLNISPDKTDFLQLRLSGRVRSLGLSNFDEYLAVLKDADSDEEPRLLVEALTTHTTSFFREIHQYQWLENEGFELLSADKACAGRSFVVWSAACSTGAELWSAAMILSESIQNFPDRFRSFDLIGTDISRAVVQRAQTAIYTMDEISGVSQERRQKFLLTSKRNLDRNRRPVARIVPEIRNRAEFSLCNLVNVGDLKSFSADVIFLRNVLIYFSLQEQEKIISSVLSRLRKGGVLMTGHAESIRKRAGVKLISPKIYQKV